MGVCVHVCVLCYVAHDYTQQGSLPAVLCVSIVGNQRCTCWELQMPVPRLLSPLLSVRLCPQPTGRQRLERWTLLVCSGPVLPQERDELCDTF